VEVTARPAAPSDIPRLVALYRELEHEMVELKPVWRLTDGLPEPVEAAFSMILADPGAHLIVGAIDDLVFGFLHGAIGDLLPQADGRRVGSVQHVFTSRPAREVGVGEAMIEQFLSVLDERGVRLVDAVAPPGQRNTKNFYESHGFKARRIVMHRNLEDEE
jgi:ribosomal protein S18 acetylase RimI-like enzyme